MNRSYESLALFLTLFSCNDPVGGEGDGDAASDSGGSSGTAGSSASGSGSGASGGSGAGLGGTAATGSGGSSAGSAGSSGGSAGSMAGSGGTIYECNAVPANAPTFQRIHSDEPAPAGKGGTIVDGTYIVTSSTWYQAPEGVTEETLDGIRMEIAGDTWEEALDWPTDDTQNLADRYTHYVSTESNTLTTTQLCPTHFPSETFEYTAEGDTVTVYVSDGVSIFGMTLTRQ